jgi:hypothetical protein
MTVVPASTAAAAAAWCAGLPILPMAVWTAVLWYGGEALLSLTAGWRWTPFSLVASVVRDAMAIAVWGVAWFRTHYVWRGQSVDLGRPARAASHDRQLR